MQASSSNAALAAFDIARLRNKMSSALSSGERQRDMVRALAARPAHLLLDEPFANVEPTDIDDIQALVRQLTRRGIGVLLADEFNRDTRQTLDVSDRAYVICSGNVLGTLVA